MVELENIVDSNKLQSDQNATKRELLKATSVVGGAQVFVIILGILRTKIIALLLGPAGIGIAGVLQSVVDLIRNATSFGINFSGVKDIAQAADSGDDNKISRTITVVRRWALYTGLLGMLVTIALCVPLSRFSFENDNYAISIAILSVTLFISSVSQTQIALLQGLRKIKQMAKATLLGAIIGTVIVIPLYWWLGVNGIVPAIILVGLGTLIVSWYFARQVQVIPIKMTLKETFKEGLSMAKIGFSVVLVGFIVIVAMYVSRAIVLEKSSMDGVGYFQAVFAITNIYLSLVLNAMLADYLPRLSAIVSDNNALKKLIDNQVEIAMSLGASLVALMVTFAPLAITILYSAKFEPAIPLLKLQMLGAITIFMAWPLEVVFLAKAKSKYYVYINLITNIIYVGVMFFGWQHWGLATIGISYIVTVTTKFILTYYCVTKLTAYKFSRFNVKFISINLLLIVSIFICRYFFDNLWALCLSVILCLLVVFYCFIVLNRSMHIVSFVKSKLKR